MLYLLCYTSLLFGTNSFHALIREMHVLHYGFMLLTIVSTTNHVLSSTNMHVRIADWVVAHTLFVYQMYIAVLYAKNSFSLWASWLCGFEIVRIFHVMGVYKNNDSVLLHGWMHVVCVAGSHFLMLSMSPRHLI